MGGVFNTVNANLYHYAGNNPVKYIDPDGKETYDSEITEEQYRNSFFLQQQMSWEDVQNFFNENQNGVLHRPEDQVSFMSLDSKKDIIDINDGSQIMVDMLLVFRGVVSLGKNILKQSQSIKTSSQKIVKSSGRTVAKNLSEQLAMEQVKSAPEAGKILPIVMNDTKNGWLANDGWVKMAQNVNGIEIHYIKNTITDIFTDFKFK